MIHDIISSLRSFLASLMAFFLLVSNPVSHVWCQDESEFHDLEIFEDFGKVVDRFQGNSGRCIILVQDLHCVPDVQRNIAKIIDRISSAYGVTLIGLEGAAGIVDPSFFGTFSDPALRSALLNILLNDGSLTGSEWAAAKSESELELWGVEESASYDANLRAFAQHRRGGSEILQTMDRLRKQLDQLKRKLLGEDRLRLDEAYWKYRSGRLTLKTYAQLLAKYGRGRGRGVQLPKPLLDYLRLLAITRRLDPETFYKEFMFLVDSVSQTQPKEEITSLVKLILNYRAGRISEGRFFSELRQWAKKQIVPLDRFANVRRYLEASKLRESFDLVRLDRAMERLTDQLVDSALFGQTRFLLQVRDFYALSLSAEDWNELRLILKPSLIVERLIRHGLGPLSGDDLEKIEAWTHVSRLYYDAACRRNDIMVRYLLKKMKHKKVRESILVAGGFHTPGITAALRKQDVSYTVILPRARRLEPLQYEEHLQAQPLGIEKLLLSSGRLNLGQATRTSADSLAPPIGTALRPLSYPWLRQLLIEKSHLLYMLLSHWEARDQFDPSVIEKARDSFLKSVDAQDRDVMASFLDSLKMGRVALDPSGRVWLKGSVAGRAWLFVLGQTPIKPSESGVTVIAEGVLDEKTAFQVFDPLAYNLLRDSVSDSTHLSFVEVMTETPQTPGGLQMDLTLRTENLDHFLSDPDHNLQMRGRISGGPFTGTGQIESGQMNLFRYNPALERLEMIYRGLIRADGRTYRFEGVKKLENDFGLDFSKDMTRLHTKIWLVESGRESLVWRGMLRFNLLNLPSLLKSIDFSGGASRWQFMAKLRFIRFVATHMAKTYLNPLHTVFRRKPSPIKPDINRVRLSSDRSSLSTESFDAVIIGSGFGASPVALRLAEAGLKVAVLERGREIPVGDFPDTLSGIMNEIRGIPDVHFHLPGPGRSETIAGLTWNRMGMLDFKLDTENPDGVHVLVGQGLGGTSLIYSNVMMRPSQDVFENLRWPREIAGELGPYFDRALQIMNVSTVAESSLLPQGVLLRKTQALFAAAAPDAQKRLAPIAVNFSKDKPFPLPGYPNQPECTLCGDCTSGCNVGAKNTLMMNYLPEAFKAGARIFTQVEVSHLQRDPQGGFRIFYHHTDELDNMGRKAPLREIRAPRVVLSAGIASTAILEQSRRKDPSFSISPMLGKSFSTNADLPAVGYNTRLVTDTLGFGNRDDERSSMAVGPVITGLVDLRSRSSEPPRQMIIEEGVIPRGLVDLLRYAMTVGLLKDITSEAALIEKLKKIKRIGIDILPGYSADGALNHSILFLTMGHDSADGRVVVDEDGNWKVEWPDAAKQEAFENMRAEHREMTRRIGGSHLPKLIRQAVTIHPLGGVPMGQTRTEGVVNHRGQVFDMNGKTPDAVIPGLYVIDASIIPTSLGVNPALTIAALAERVAEKIVEHDIPPLPLVEPNSVSFATLPHQDYFDQAA